MARLRTIVSHRRLSGRPAAGVKSEARVLIRFDRGGRTYFPGETLGGEYRIEGLWPEDIRAVELSVLWHTEGKGDEDLAVHHFQRIPPDDFEMHGPPTGQFETVLPNSPLSYEGVTIKLRWCVRVRVFPRRGKEVVGEAGFRLGNLPAVEASWP
ncbi:MAG TPA: hypothetical protein EYH34_01895 [Planctomycetes bacterium]|nr:hypothetical protein [Planctomycetota bacterium]